MAVREGLTTSRGGRDHPGGEAFGRTKLRSAYLVPVVNLMEISRIDASILSPVIYCQCQFQNMKVEEQKIVKMRSLRLKENVWFAEIIGGEAMLLICSQTVFPSLLKADNLQDTSSLPPPPPKHFRRLKCHFMASESEN